MNIALIYGGTSCERDVSVITGIQAMGMLDSTNKTVAEISDEFHFPNPSSFGTFFRKQTGLSPQKYRERL